MCTVTYVPTSRGFVLTHNRDEVPERSGATLVIEDTHKQRLLFPRDPLAGGTWMALSDRGFTACLLNGAFLKHRRTPPYRLSRGVMLLDLVRSSEPLVHLAAYELADIEPFTLVYADFYRLVEFRWDGRNRHLRHLPPRQPHLWASATLYEPPVLERRRESLMQWLERHRQPSPSGLRHLHLRNNPDDPESTFYMHGHDRIRTVSLTQVAFGPSALRLYHRNLLHEEQLLKKTLQYKKSPTEEVT